MPLVRVDSVVKTYREGAAETTVLRGASLELRGGEITSLVGASGSGKSTLLGLIAGLGRPDRGAIVFDGQEIGGMDPLHRDRLRGTRIGVVLQTGNLVPFLTALENVELVQDLGGRRSSSAARGLLGQVGLEHRLHHRPARLSGGEAQRVAIAMAVANQPDLLLADEVTGALDSMTAEHVMEVIFDLSRTSGLTVLFVTHDAGLATKAEHRLQLADGEVVGA